jgi:hypothetical protein
VRSMSMSQSTAAYSAIVAKDRSISERRAATRWPLPSMLGWAWAPRVDKAQGARAMYVDGTRRHPMWFDRWRDQELVIDERSRIVTDSTSTIQYYYPYCYWYMRWCRSSTYIVVPQGSQCSCIQCKALQPNILNASVRTSTINSIEIK